MLVDGCILQCRKHTITTIFVMFIGNTANRANDGPF